MRGRPEHRRHLSIQMPAHRDLFAGRFGMKIDHDDFGLDPRKQLSRGVKWIVFATHKNASHEIYDGVAGSALGGAFEDPVPRKTWGKVGWTQNAARALLTLGG